MSLLPLLYEDFCTSRPVRLLDQHFGLELDRTDFLIPFSIPQILNSLILPNSYYRHSGSQPSQKDIVPDVSIDQSKFQVNLDVQNFVSEEITVKVTRENMISIEGTQEEKLDEHGYIFRQFARKYPLPKGYDIQSIESKLSSDGILTVLAQRNEVKPIEERIIPIEYTGIPARAVTIRDKCEQIECIVQNS
ncbi:heat shock protein hsp-12.2-related [Holotrichia oblita]|uniref:Heat shock protein hsp-12.2-related n=1 Tax=Holotrichia oblita TaxID=644536 RepID=A0ACB9SKN6_HOLOL|nr:heat shock protein hsp-12.2-related [Holotrichia oblita]